MFCFKGVLLLLRLSFVVSQNTATTIATTDSTAVATKLLVTTTTTTKSPSNTTTTTKSPSTTTATIISPLTTTTTKSPSTTTATKSPLTTTTTKSPSTTTTTKFPSITTTTTAMLAPINEQYSDCNTTEYCNDRGHCFANLVNTSKRICSCDADFYGHQCQSKDNTLYKKSLFGVAILAGILFFAVLVVSCLLNTKIDQIEQEKLNFEREEREKEGKRKADKLRQESLKIVRSRQSSVKSTASSTQSSENLRPANQNGRLHHRMPYYQHEKERNLSVVVEIPNNEEKNNELTIERSSNFLTATKNDSDVESTSSIILGDDEQELIKVSPKVEKRSKTQKGKPESKKNKQNGFQPSLDAQQKMTKQPITYDRSIDKNYEESPV